MTIWRLLAKIAAVVALSVYVGLSWGGDRTAGQVSVRIIEINKSPTVEKIPVISGVAVDPTGKLLATVGDDHILRIWNLDDGTVLYRLAAHTDWIKAVSFRPDGKAVATAGDDRRIRIWDITTAGQPAELPEQNQAIHALVYSPDGKLLASAGFDDKVRLFTSDGRLPKELDGPGSDLRALAFSPDGTQLAAAGRSGAIHLWNVATGSKTAEIQASAHRISALGVFAQRSPIGRGWRRSRDQALRSGFRQSLDGIARVSPEKSGPLFFTVKNCWRPVERTT